MKKPPIIYWIRNDLRLSDNPALRDSAAEGPVIPIYIWDPCAEGAWPLGAAARTWLHISLQALGAAYRQHGSRLLLRSGDTAQILLTLCAETGASSVYAEQRYEPAARHHEAVVRDTLRPADITLRLYPGNLLNSPDAIMTQAGGPYQVFTPYYRACQARQTAEPIAAPGRIAAPPSWPQSAELSFLGLLPAHPWAERMLRHWEVGETAAQDKLDQFTRTRMSAYTTDRDVPGMSGTSSLSPHLRFGEITPRQIVHASYAAASAGQFPPSGAEAYIRQIYWREFAYHLLYHYPDTPNTPLRPMFSVFPWAKNGNGLAHWKRGQTGYPFIDAAMRELWETGWMHNRARMAASSFLVKDLRVDWREGAAWFWDTLVDADLANNTLGWQWVAGCGADAAPYFRIFNPITQGRKFDENGAYVRRWIPALAAVPDQFVQSPWLLTPIEQAGAGIELGRDYPRPIVDHAEARATALALYDELRSLT